MYNRFSFVGQIFICCSIGKCIDRFVRYPLIYIIVSYMLLHSVLRFILSLHVDRPQRASPATQLPPRLMTLKSLRAFRQADFPHSSTSAGPSHCDRHDQRTITLQREEYFGRTFYTLHAVFSSIPDKSRFYDRDQSDDDPDTEGKRCRGTLAVRKIAMLRSATAWAGSKRRAN